MKASSVVLSCVILILVGFVSCRMGQTYNVEDTAAPASGKTLTLKEVTTTLVNAGNTYGWAMSVQKPGPNIGTLSVRSHVAVVDFTYATESYNITYKDSQNLKYDSSQKSIYTNYCSWIRRLQVSIQRAFTVL